MPREIAPPLAHERLIRAYTRRQIIEGPKLWRLRAEVLDRCGMPSTIQHLLRRAGYVSPASVRILDLGCGRGYKNDLIINSAVTSEAKEISIVGCDLMEQPEIHHPVDPRARFTFRVVPAERIVESFGLESFDVVTSIAMHHHLGDLWQVAEQVHAVLKPGGIHLIADNFCWDGSPLKTLLSKTWVRLYQWCEGNGFYNEATCSDVLSAQRRSGFEILGTFTAPLFVEGLLGRKCGEERLSHAASLR